MEDGWYSCNLLAQRNVLTVCIKYLFPLIDFLFYYQNFAFHRKLRDEYDKLEGALRKLGVDSGALQV